MKPYPLLLRPVIKDYLWGGRRLIDEYHFECDGNVAAEGWMLACHKDGTNVICNGECAGQRLDTVLRAWGYDPDAFPLLIKLIDAADRLSVQVHPDDEFAYEHEGEAGKTEMWYVVDAAADAALVYGLNRSVTKEEFSRRIADNTLPEILNFVPVRKGDVFFIESGTIHAIGAGLLIAEIQQNSNTTYRVSDYGRLGADGKPRELHIDKALQVTSLTPPSRPYGATGERHATEHGEHRLLAECRYFRTESVELQGTMALTGDPFLSVLCLNGTAILRHDGQEWHLGKGDSLFLPRGIAAELSGSASLILSQVGS